MQKVIINPGYGGSSSGIISGSFIEKNFNLQIGEVIFNYLKNLGINTYLIRETDSTLSNQERLTTINSIVNQGDEVVVITIQMIESNESGAQVVYSLRDIDTLARGISDAIETTGQEVSKFYQYRNPNATSEDYYEMIRELDTTENVIISLGNPNNSFDNGFLLNNIERLGNNIADAINNYLTKQNVYIVARGDTLSSIARKFNITVDELKEANNLNNNALIVGQELLIPKTQELDQDTTGEDEEMDMFVTYTVKKGDSLYSIANSYNTTVDIIKDINNLTNNTLTLGQTLKIPTSTTNQETNYNNYIVQKGDSLYSIAMKFNTTVDAIKNLNNLSSNTLSIGKNLKIPSQSGTNEQEENYSNYTVKSGDSLYKIASLYQTSVNAIKNLNNLSSNTLSIGQVLKIPIGETTNNIPTANYITYTVVSGDSLYKIANQYNITVDQIKAFNNLTSNNLSIGQTLKIPTTSNISPTPSYQTYTVVSGDSLYRIAIKFNTNIDAIKSLNNLNSNNLSIGQTLKIPN